MKDKMILHTLEEGDLIEYVRKDGTHDIIYLKGKIKKKDNGGIVLDGWHHLGIEDGGYNEHINIYKRQENGDYKVTNIK